MQKSIRFCWLFLVLFVVTAPTACVQIPETGKSALILTTQSQENQLGEDGYKEVLKEAKVSTNKRANTILQRVGKAIAAQANRPDFKWEYTLIESKEMNAWCMPGGKIAVYTGILPFMKNEAGMATVLGHEVAHATLRHSGQRISQQMILGLGLSAADISLGSSQHRDTLMGLLGAGATVGIMLPYGRGHESEADRVGLKYMAKAGYDPREAVRFWQRFSKGTGSGPPEFLSTHPSGGRRIRDLQAEQSVAMRYYKNARAQRGIGENF